MALSPELLLREVPPIPSHALVALAMIGLGAWQLTGAKGTARHRIVGWLFVAGMSYVAISGLFISTIGTWGWFSPIHLLVPVTLLGLYGAVRDARRGEIREHKRGMILLFMLALVLTGAFTLLPGRVMHKIVFGTPISEVAQ